MRCADVSMLAGCCAASWPPALRFNVPTLHFVLLVPFLAASLRETTASLPLDPRPCQMPTRPADPVHAVEPHLDHHVKSRPYPSFRLWPRLAVRSFHKAPTPTVTATLCRQPYVPLDLCVFTRPVKVLASVIDSHIYLPCSVFPYTPHPPSALGRDVCRALSVLLATRDGECTRTHLVHCLGELSVFRCICEAQR